MLTKNKAINQLRDMMQDILFHMNGDEYDLEYIKDFNAVAMAIVALCDKWTAVNERPPKDGQDVLVTIKSSNGKFVKPATYFGDGKHTQYFVTDGMMYKTDKEYDFKIVAWQPLPSPYDG